MPCRRSFADRRSPLLIVGDGVDGGAIEEKTRRLGLGDHAENVGDGCDIPELLGRDGCQGSLVPYGGQSRLHARGVGLRPAGRTPRVGSWPRRCSTGGLAALRAGQPRRPGRRPPPMLSTPARPRRQARPGENWSATLHRGSHGPRLRRLDRRNLSSGVPRRAADARGVRPLDEPCTSQRAAIFRGSCCRRTGPVGWCGMTNPGRLAGLQRLVGTVRALAQAPPHQLPTTRRRDGPGDLVLRLLLHGGPARFSLLPTFGPWAFGIWHWILNLAIVRPGPLYTPRKRPLL